MKVQTQDNLKALLMGSELKALARLRRRQNQLWNRVGRDPALRETVRKQIVEILREADINEHERLAGVLAPVILSSMREEIMNSTDLMVDALYPITGRLVSAAVRDAFQKLLQRIEQQLDNTFSAERWRIRLKARMTGRSAAELLLEKYPPFYIEELYVIHRKTGLLIARSGDRDGQEAPLDGDLLGSMLSAITSFAKEAFGGDAQSELETLELGDSQLFLANAPAILLVVRTSGTVPAGFHAALEPAFIDFLDEWGEPLRAFDGSLDQEIEDRLTADLRRLLGDLLHRQKRGFKKPSRKAWIFLVVVAAALGYWAYDAYAEASRIAEIEDGARQVIAAQPALTGYYFYVQFDRNANTLRVEGVAPDGATRMRLRTALGKRFPALITKARINLLPQTPKPPKPPEPPKAETRARGIIAGDRGLAGYFFDIRYDQSAKVLRIRGLAPDRAARNRIVAALKSGIPGVKLDLRVNLLPAPPRTPPLERLETFARRHTIKFAELAELRYPAKAEATARMLAALVLKASGKVRLRIVGYTDDLGSEAQNRRLSVRRAEKVADLLVVAGLPRERLAIAGRATFRALTADKKHRYDNRRVEFELTYGE